MDAAAVEQIVERRVAQAVRDNDARHREIAEAVEAVRPKAGRIAMDSSITSAADVYSRALRVLGVDHAGIRDALALRRLFDLAPRPGGDPGRRDGLALDVAPRDARANFNKRYPGAARIESGGF